MANASRFKLHDVLINDCCALSCDAPAAKQFGSPVPLCERHLMTVYRSVNRHLQAERANSQDYQLFSLDQITGPCPACGASGYLHRTAENIVQCKNESCRYTAEFDKFEQVRRKALFDLAGTKPVVYYVGFRDLIKIGTTTNLQTRWSCLTAAESLLGFEYGDRKHELMRHKQFSIYRVDREWFINNAQLRAHINEVAVTS